MGRGKPNDDFTNVEAAAPSEVRRLMLLPGADASTAGLLMGYDSATQFSREYRRLFGAPPWQDVRRLR